MPERVHDLVLLGATGFTGRLVAAHLAARTHGLRWAIAGRDRGRLEAVADTVAAPAGATRPEVVVADVGELTSLLDLAASTRVLATTVGPYARLGEPVAQACIRAGTHYADITGEPGFVTRLRDRYHADALRQEVTLVTCCGFDSVPHDLGAWWTVQQLPDDAPIRVRAYVRMQSRLSGGTLRSAVGAVADGDLPRAGGARRDEAPRRSARALPARIHRVAELGGWGIPLPTIDPAIVLRSARQLDGYGTAFRYGHYLHVRRLPTAATGIAAVGGAAALARLGPTRRLLERTLPASGEGPDEETRARSSFSVTFLASSGSQRLTTRVSGGDPGYDETARMLGEAALTLASETGPAAHGVVTPAMGLGPGYVDRLIDQGLRFEVLPG